MTCFNPRILYANPPFRGLAFAGQRGDGYSAELKWIQAYSGSPPFLIGYNIYYSKYEADVFTEGVKYVVTNSTTLSGNIYDLTAGSVYYFAVRAFLYNPNDVTITGLPDAGNGYKVYPEAALLTDLTTTSLTIHVSDIDQFPATGIVQVGVELITYTGKDLVTNSLVLSDISGRGYYSTTITEHLTDGYDGYVYRDPLVKFFKGFEDNNTSIVYVHNDFFENYYPRTNADGYREQKDTFTTTADLAPDEAANMDFPAYDYAGYRRTDPVDLLAGKCVGSYYGGQYYCADGYGGVGRMVRGLSISDINNQRQELLLTTTGEPVALLRRQWTGKTCRCMNALRETPEYRCPICLGTGVVDPYIQFFSPRRSDGRILVRFDPTVEDLIPTESGLNPDYKPNAWTLSVPIVRDRDFLIRFNSDGSEEFRYEILNVTRNKIPLNAVGAQKMTLVRVQKTDPIYQFRAFRNTATMPQTITTSIAMVSGPGGIVPHMHSVVINENILTVSQINETTGIAQGHTHPIINGAVQMVLGHTHDIILP